MYAHPSFIRGCPEYLSRLKKCTNAADRRRLAESAKITQDDHHLGTCYNHNEYSDQDQTSTHQWQSTPSSPSYSTDDTFSVDSNGSLTPKYQEEYYMKKSGGAIDHATNNEPSSSSFNIMEKFAPHQESYIMAPQEAKKNEAFVMATDTPVSRGCFPNGSTSRLSLLAHAVTAIVNMES
mmetsp:Transcript_10128/g.12888  ORF Transcript_10128/g.12888 Transcript_10128/m.12888 type:complete len:179 (-) Transcript_10128:198-734(-)